MDPERFPEFPFDDTEVVVTLSDGEELTCTKYDTSAYFYTGQYELFSHVYHIRENGQPLYMFNAMRLAVRLRQKGYDSYESSLPPSDLDQKVFFEWAGEKLLWGAMGYLKEQDGK